MEKKIPVKLFFNPLQDVDYYSNLLQDNLDIVVNEKQPEFVIAVGGDGTFLRAVHQNLSLLNKCVFLGINTGSLGFFADYDIDELDDINSSINDISKRKVVTSSLLKGEITYEGKKKIIYAINEIKLENPFQTLICDVYINDDLLEVFRGTGLIVSSSIGSSGLSRSLGGALVDPALETLQLSEEASIQNNIYRSLASSLIIDKNGIITLKGNFEKVIVGYDYLYETLNNVTELKICLSHKKMKIAKKANHSYINTVEKSFIK